ncbi:hypothetical protein [Pseudomonas antarctica]|uniref:hypothetical protein n=1 Tax=Pseudomonas antarctica TaxID=219572 RepID=UPI003F74E9A8
MITVQPLRFAKQDSATPTPNFNTSQEPGDFVELTSNTPLLKEDFVVAVMSSTVTGITGGQFNQSFEVGADSASLQLFIPKKHVVANSGKAVQLQLRITRQKVSSSSPNATVTINQGVVVVPTPGTLWDFSDGTLQDWVAQGRYIGGAVKISNGRVFAELTNSQPGGSHIITRSVQVVSGRTYDCSYTASTDLPATDGSRLHMTINGASIGPTAAVTPGFTTLGTGRFVADRTGAMHLGIFNESVPTGILHRLYLDNIRMAELP